MVSPTHIMFEFRLLCEKNSWTLSVMVSIFKNSCVDVWKNMSPVDGISSHYLVGMPIMRLHGASSTFTDVFCSTPPSGGLFPYFCYSFFWMLMHPLLVLSVCRIYCFPHCDLFPRNYCRWCVQGFFGGFVYPLLCHLHNPQFLHAVKI